MCLYFSPCEKKRFKKKKKVVYKVILKTQSPLPNGNPIFTFSVTGQSSSFSVPEIMNRNLLFWVVTTLCCCLCDTRAHPTSKTVSGLFMRKPELEHPVPPAAKTDSVYESSADSHSASSHSLVSTMKEWPVMGRRGDDEGMAPSPLANMVQPVRTRQGDLLKISRDKTPQPPWEPVPVLHHSYSTEVLPGV